MLDFSKAFKRNAKSFQKECLELSKSSLENFYISLLQKQNFVTFPIETLSVLVNPFLKCHLAFYFFLFIVPT